MILHPLDDGWTLTLEHPGDGAPDALAGTEVRAAVPGCVHTDLLAAGLIPDPTLERNEDDVQWIGESDWRYACRPELPGALLAEDRLDLVFDGLDTVAEVRLNGATLGRTRNQHRRYRLDARAAARPGANALEVSFASAMRSAREEAERLGERPRAYGPPFNFLRKAACNFGWDWGPTLVTAGVWRPARLEAWSCARLAQVRPLVHLDRWPVGRSETPLADGAPTADAPDGRVDVHVQLERAGAPADVRLSARLVGPDGAPAARATCTVPAAARTAELRLDVPRPEVWWPRGYGAQPRYTLTLELSRAEERGDTRDDGAGAAREAPLLDRWERRIGFRSPALDASEDALGRAFTLVVNGRRVFAHGVNWIPDDVFPVRVGPERYRERLRQAADAGVNLVRVWGGGLYEDDAFYEACDELGLLVWQDFAFACAAYPEEPPFSEEVEAEAADAIVRLMPHPSLVLYNGNNENLWGHEDWGWKAALQGRSWGRGFYLHTLPRLVATLDPTRPYWPGSPWSGSEDVPPNDERHGCMHVWDAWNEKDCSVYLEKRPRFVSEFGHQGPAAYATLARAISERPLRPDGPGMLHHQKAVGGNDKLERRLAEHFPVPTDVDAWHFATQLHQARAVELGLRHFRSLAPACMGAVVWQLNDCWPVTSWAAVDGDGRRKPLWYALRRAFAPRLLSLLPALGEEGSGDAGVRLALHNDTDDPWQARVRVRRVALDGDERATGEVAVTVPPRGTRTVALAPELTRPDDAGAELLLADEPGQRAVYAFARDRALRYPRAAFDAALEVRGPDHRLTVTARGVLRDLTLQPDRLAADAVADDALVTLLPGERHTFVITSDTRMRLEDLTRTPVLWSANDLVAPREAAADA